MSSDDGAVGPSTVTAGVRHASEEQLRTIIDAFAQISWPAPAESVEWLLEKLVWNRVDLRLAEMRLFSSEDSASILLDNNEEGEGVLFDYLSFWAGESMEGLGEAKALAMYRTVVDWVTQIVGPAVDTWEPSQHPDAGPDFPAAWWELPSGGGVQLFFVNDVVKMRLMSKKAADLQRFARRHQKFAQ